MDGTKVCKPVSFVHTANRVMVTTIMAILSIVFMLGIAYLLSIQENKNVQRPVKKRVRFNNTVEFAVVKETPDAHPRFMNDFVPVEDHIVPTHASHTNKFNNELGAKTTAAYGPALLEVVYPSDFYTSTYPPSMFDGPYWPKGSIEPDYIYPGSDPARPLRST
jgi:hypothetical protein